MSIESDGKRLQLRIAAPEGGAPLRLKDGDTVLWEGNLAQGLDLEFDLEDWGVPEALRQLLSISLPSVDRYSREAFVPLDTALISLATLDVDPATGRGRWSDRAILPGQMLPLSMMSGVLHYAQSVFEGAKVFFVRDGDGVSARMFRGRRNAARMWRSALRMGIPLDTSEVGPMPLTAQGFEELYLALVRDAVMANVRAGLFEGAFSALDVASDDFNWTATPPALYVRPLLFASGPVLGVKPSGHYTFAVYVTPVGKYRSDMVLRVEREHPRAVKGGTGGVKASCNYAPTLTLMKALTENKASVTASTPWMSVFDDILFLGPGEQIEEMGLNPFKDF